MPSTSPPAIRPQVLRPDGRRAGKPAYVEKPMAHELVECQAMIETFSRRRRSPVCAYYRRTLDRFLKVKEIVETAGSASRAPSRSRSTGRTSRRRPERPTGTWTPPSRAEDTSSIWEATRSISWITSSAPSARPRPGDEPGKAVRRGRHRGRRLRVRVPAWKAPSLVVRQPDPGGPHRDPRHSRPRRLRDLRQCARPAPDRQRDDRVRDPTPPHVQQPLIQTVVDQLNGTGRCPSTGETAIRTTRVMDEILASYYAPRP